MKKSILALFLALMLCMTVFLVACEDPQGPDGDETPGDTSAADAERKDTVAAYLNAANTSTGDTTTQLPDVNTAIDQVFGALQTLEITGLASTTQGLGGAATVNFSLKDGVIYTKSIEEGSPDTYMYLDESFNLITVTDIPGEWTDAKVVPFSDMISVTSPDMPAIPDLSMIAGMIPEEVRLPAFPTITVDDLVVSGDRVSLSGEYIKSLVPVLLEASGMVEGMSAMEVAEMVGMINATLDTFDIDMYILVNSEMKITGYGVDVSRETSDVTGQMAFVTASVGASYAVTIDPATGMLTGATVSFEMNPVKVNANLAITYAEGAIATVTADAEYSITYAGEYTVTMTVDADLDMTALTQETATIVSVSADSVMTPAAAGSEPVSVISYLAEIKKDGAKYTAKLDSESPEGSSAMSLEIDTAATVTIPTMSVAAQEAKAAAETYIANRTLIEAVAEDLEKMEYAVPSGGYFYYFDEDLNTSFWIEPSYVDETVAEPVFSGWDINFNFSLGSEDSISVMKDGDSYQAITESEPVEPGPVEPVAPEPEV